LAQKHLRAATHVVSDGLSCFASVTTAGCTHEAIVTGGGPASVNHEAFTWVNTMLGNVKNAIQGMYHGISDQHAPRYLAEFRLKNVSKAKIAFSLRGLKNCKDVIFQGPHKVWPWVAALRELFLS